MAMTDANVTSYIRSLLSEASAKYWTDAEVILYKQAAMDVIQSQFYPYLYEVKKTFELKTKTVDTQNYALPTDSFKISGVEVAESGRRLRYINDDEYHKYAQWADGDPVVWMFKGGEIYVMPKPPATETDYWRIWYMPLMDSVTDFPAYLRPLIGIEAVIHAKTKDENVSAGEMALHKRMFEAAMMAAALAQMQEATIMGDYELEDTYSEIYNGE